MTERSLAEKLEAALSRQTIRPSSVVNIEPLTGGAASRTWRFDWLLGGQRRACILRCASAGADFAVGIGKTLEACIQQRCFEAGVPVAEVLSVLCPEDELGEGYVMHYLAGETIPQKILRKPEFDGVRPLLAAQCGELLADIHRVPAPKELEAQSTEQQLTELEQQYRSYGHPLPAFDLAFRWLAGNLPEPVPAVLVHGDFRNGNFLVTPERGIVGILDWELCHLGDPMEDLGWLCVNSWRFGQRELPVGGFGQRDALYWSYAEAMGNPVDPERVHFWEVLGTLKWGVMCLHMCLSPSSAEPLTLERAAIGRRVSETEVDLLVLLAEEG